MLLRYLLLNESLPSDDLELFGPRSSVAPALEEAPPPSTDSAPAGASARPVPASESATETIRGRVSIAGRGAAGAYVYVENVAAPPGSGSLEIKQRDKQFVPRVAAVQRGTRLIFSNSDAIFHNVFSSTPGFAFDLGAYRSGDPPRVVPTPKSGVIEVFCNMHSRMSSTILVVPNGLFAKVDHDGRFELHNVPLGLRKVVAWAPDAKPAKEDIELRAGGAELSFSLEATSPKAHLNKLGQPYGSYEE
jgi:plastocyanin